MERVEGQTLREALGRGPCATGKLLDIASQLAEGLARAHGAGIVHRDLKPENVMVTKDGLVKILDFGLAKESAIAPEPSDVSTAVLPDKLTQAGVAVGTLPYMSPEQAVGRPVDFRSDQFSLRLMLYETAAGRRPFGGETADQRLWALLREEPRPLGEVSAEVPAGLVRIVGHCLAKQPEDRYGSTGDLARDLKDLRMGLIEARGASAARPRPRGRRGLLALGAVVLLGRASGSGDRGRRQALRRDPPRSPRSQSCRSRASAERTKRNTSPTVWRRRPPHARGDSSCHRAFPGSQPS